jgi:DNA-binding phage protein
MRKLPEPGDPCHDLLVALRDLHLHAGEPSTRAIARSAGRAVSHDTVNRVLRGDGLPSWTSLEFVVKALGGDVEAFRKLWVSARCAEGQGSG